MKLKAAPTLKNSRKRDYELAVKKTVSMPGLLYDRATDRSRQVGYSTFSDYIQSLIRNDVKVETRA